MRRDSLIAPCLPPKASECAARYVLEGSYSCPRATEARMIGDNGTRDWTSPYLIYGRLFVSVCLNRHNKAMHWRCSDALFTVVVATLRRIASSFEEPLI